MRGRRKKEKGKKKKGLQLQLSASVEELHWWGLQWELLKEKTLVNTCMYFRPFRKMKDVFVWLEQSIDPVLKLFWQTAKELLIFHVLKPKVLLYQTTEVAGKGKTDALRLRGDGNENKWSEILNFEQDFSLQYFLIMLSGFSQCLS